MTQNQKVVQISSNPRFSATKIDLNPSQSRVPKPSHYRAESNTPKDLDQPRRRREAPEVYRRRRIMAGLAGIAAAAGSVAGVSALRDDRPSAPTFNPGTEANPHDYETETIDPGESLWSIAAREQRENDYKDDVRDMTAELMEQNGDSALVQPGQQLLIPKNVEERQQNLDAQQPNQNQG